MKRRLPRKQKKQIKKQLFNDYYSQILGQYFKYMLKGGHLNAIQFFKNSLTIAYKEEVKKLNFIKNIRRWL